METTDPPRQFEPERYERFTSLLVTHQPALHAFVVALAPHGADIDELLQLTSLAAWRKFDQFDPQTSFLRWICQIAKFELMNQLRKRRRDRHIFNDELLSLIAEETMAESDRLAAERTALEACVAKLPRQDRELICRCYATGANVAEIAKAVGRTTNSLYKWLNRTRLILLHCIQSSLGREGFA